MKNEAPRTIKFQVGCINKIICYTYKKKKKQAQFSFFFLASECYNIILPV